MYHDLHDPDPSQRYKISGGSPAGCFDSTGSKQCVVGTAGSPDGINNWTHVTKLAFPHPWRPDCHTKLFYDYRTTEYRMTTRDYTRSSGRDISITVSGGSSSGKHWPANWTLLYPNQYPPTTSAGSCTKLKQMPGQTAEDACGLHCHNVDNCAYFFVYTSGRDMGNCCPKTAVLPGKVETPACPAPKCNSGALLCLLSFQLEFKEQQPVFSRILQDGWQPPSTAGSGTIEIPKQSIRLELTYNCRNRGDSPSALLSNYIPLL